MNKLDILYEDKKKEVFSYYLVYDGINGENISDINNTIIDKKIDKKELENDLLEFYITVSMCSYMVNNDLYDEYFFKTYVELLDDYNSGKFDNLFKDIISDKEILDNDIESLNEYLKKEEIKAKYYDDVSNIYNEEINSLDEE